jgi:nitrite reductase (NADH) large subunit
MDCDLLVIAAGVVPNTHLARDAGMVVARGIVVGDDLACPDTDGIHAIGDCAEHRGQSFGLVAPAWEQARVLATRLTGAQPDAKYEGTRLSTKLKVAGVDVAVMGDRDPAPDDEVVTYSEPSRGVYSRVIVRDDRVAGAILVGPSSAAPLLIQRFLDASPVPAQRSELLFPSGTDLAPRSVDEMPDTARVCDCNAVIKAQIVDAVLNGARSLRSVCEGTRAGTGCGSCRPEVQRIVDFTCRELERGGARAST